MVRIALLFSAVLLIPAPSLAADELPQRPPALSDVAPDVVAVVNGKELTRDQLAALAVGAYGRQLLETLISQEVVRQEAARRGITFREEELAEFTRRRAGEHLDEMARRVGAKDAADLAARAGETAEALEPLRRRAEEALKPFVVPELLVMKMLSQEIEISDEQVRTEFDRRHAPKARVLQIVLGTRSEAERVLEKLRQGADFRQLVQEVSKDAVSRRKGGEMPPLPPFSILGKAAFALKPGEVSDVVETSDGFHLLRLVEIVQAEETSYEEARETLHREMLEQRIQEDREDWVRRLVKRAEVTRSFQGATPPVPVERE